MIDSILVLTEEELNKKVGRRVIFNYHSYVRCGSVVEADNYFLKEDDGTIRTENYFVIDTEDGNYEIPLKDILIWS